MPAESIRTRRFRWSFRRHSLMARAALIGAALLVGADHCPGQSRHTVIRNDDAPPRPTRPYAPPHPIYYPPPATTAVDNTSADSDQASPEALLDRFMHLHSTMRYDEAVKIARQVVALCPESSLAQYNLACALARVHRTDEALDALERAIGSGWQKLAHLQLDPDLQSVRWHQRYGELVVALETRLAADRPEERPLRTEPWDEVARDLSERLPRMMERHEIPGLTVAMVRDDRVVWEEAFGARCAATADPMTIDARFIVCAPTELLGVLAALQCDDRAEEHLAALAEAADERRLAGPTRRTSGPPFELASRRVRGVRRASPAVGQPGEPEGPASQSVGTGTPSRSDVRNNGNLRPEPAAEPDLLQILVELTTGTPYETYCREALFRPRAMNSTAFEATEVERAVFAVGHTALGTPVSFSPPVLGASSLCTTAGDLARLVAGCSDGAQDEPQRLVELTRRRPASAVRTRRTRDGLRVEIEGQRDGLGCLVRWYPDHGTGIVILHNGADGRTFARQVAMHALGGRP